MGDSSWQVRGSELVCVSADGTESVPTADEIYRALVEKRPTREGVPTSVDGLRVSRYPLTPALALDLPEGEKIPIYSITSECRGTLHELESADLERGHKVIDRVWYPLEPAISAEVQELMRRTGIRPGPARSLKAFLAARRAAADGGLVEDRIGDKIIPPLVFAPAADDVPTGIGVPLYCYQLSGWRWLKFLLSEGIGGLL